MEQSAVRCCLAWGLVAMCAGTGAAPLYTTDHAPPAGLLGFPAMREAAVLERGTWRGELHSAIASSHSESTAGAETVILDGETISLTARGAYGLGAGWDLEAEVSWAQHSGGFLDRWIEGWHELWDLPEGDRPGAPRDRIDFSYGGPSARFALRSAAAGPGRAHVAVTRGLRRSGAHAVSLRAGLKLGLGEEQRLLGGGRDGYVSLHWTRKHRAASALGWHAQAGLLRAGESRVLGALGARSPWFAGVGLEWPAWRRLHLKVQLDAHGPVADSALTELGDTAVLLTVAGTWAFRPGWELEFGFSEDIAPRTGPDFTPRLGIRYRPPGRSGASRGACSG